MGLTETTTQIVRIAEAELPTATAAQVAEIRVIDTAGNSKTMTLAEARIALALAPSFTEQLTGEYAFDVNGIIKPVYRRTLTGVLPSTAPNYGIQLLRGVGSIVKLISIHRPHNVDYQLTDPTFFILNQYGSIMFNISGIPNSLGYYYSVTIDYTKR